MALERLWFTKWTTEAPDREFIRALQARRALEHGLRGHSSSIGVGTIENPITCKSSTSVKRKRHLKVQRRRGRILLRDTQTRIEEQTDAR
jgi:hypothetical protein